MSDRLLNAPDTVIWNLHAIARDAIRRHGEDATLHVAQLADEALEKGHMDLRGALLKLIKEIEAIERSAPTSTGIH
jgi:hypothetical protein